jgi:glycosyltransferase involved in cell wall biosynthesis
MRRRSRQLKTAILIPCFNEEPTVGKVVSDFRAGDPAVTVYVYDNNSTDQTAARAREAGAVVVREHRQGKGNVVRSMFRDIDADCYILVDGDDTYPADEALAMRSLVADGTADMVIGDRMSSTYVQENSRPFHESGNRLVRFLVNNLFHSDLNDIMTGCRCMSRRFVKMFPVISSGFEIETEMTIHALDKGFLVREVPITYRDRAAGSESKLNTFSDGLRVLKMVAGLFRDYRPLRFFGVVASILLVVSIATFIVPLQEYLGTGLVARFPTLIVSVALGLGAMLSFACGVLLESIRTHATQFYELQLTMYEEWARSRKTSEPADT